MSENHKRSSAFLAASNHWGNASKKSKIDDSPQQRDNKKNQHDVQEIIEITSDDELVVTPNPKVKKVSQIKLLHNPSYDHSDENKINKDTVSISNLIGTKDLDETFQFNFSVDLPFFLTFLHPDFSKKKKKLTFITGSKLLASDEPELEFIKSKFNISEVIADIPNRFGTHHTKMMINFFEDNTCEVVIMTSNITKLDFGGLTQMVWRSGRLNKLVNKAKPLDKGTRFQKDLISYLLKYRKATVDSLVSKLKLYDFSPVTVELVASAPGEYTTSSYKSEDIYGFGRLLKVLERNNLLVDNRDGTKFYNFIAQVTSISYPYTVTKTGTSSIFSHVLCPLIFSGNQGFKPLESGADSFKAHQKNNYYKPSIIFPTVKEIAENNVGFGAGQAVHFNGSQSYIHKRQYDQNIRPYLHKWNSSGKTTLTGRELVVPHCKFYMCDNGDNWATLKWVLVGSHNLSKQAWGGFNKGNESKYSVSSYELGVLVFPDADDRLVPCYNSDTLDSSDDQPIRLPFKLPPVAYDKTDKIWENRNSHGTLRDKFGQTYNLD